MHDFHVLDGLPEHELVLQLRHQRSDAVRVRLYVVGRLQKLSPTFLIFLNWGKFEQLLVSHVLNSQLRRSLEMSPNQTGH